MRHKRTALVAGATMIILVGCRPGDAPLPTNINDPSATKTPSGAVAAYHGALATLALAYGGSRTPYIVSSGLLSDELQSPNIGFALGATAGEDGRVLPEYADPQQEPAAPYTVVYSQLHQTRAEAAQALGLLRDYAPAVSPALRGHLYAVQGYAEVMLAELFCSGVPLSTVDYGGDYTLRAGSSTEAVFQHASVLFDSALAISGDSARIMNLARVGKSRTLLDLGDFVQASQIAAEVPDGFSYEMSYQVASGTNTTNFAAVVPGQTPTGSVSDREGVNGLPYRSSGDPRTPSSDMGQNAYGITLYHPDKYSTDGSSPIVLADWIEARLIESEAELQAGDPSWLTTLNFLRENAIVPALPDTADPVAPTARVDLVFRERAFWLYLTGHRQGDLRRLIRGYARGSEQVYPTGAFPGGGTYGTDVDAPIPARERESNPQFTGCIGRGA